MRLWGTVRREVGGLLRSIGYDLRQRVDSVWSRADAAYPEYDAYSRKPRRVMLVSGLAAVAAVGVAGTYMALAGGLGTWILGNNNVPDHATAPDAGTVTTAAHAPGAVPKTGPKTGPKPMPSPAAPQGGTGPLRSGGLEHATTAPSGPGHPGPSRPATPAPGTSEPQPSEAPTPSPTPTPTPTPTSSPAPTPSDTPSSEPPDPSPSSDGSQQAHNRAIDLAWAQSTSVPAGA